MSRQNITPKTVSPNSLDDIPSVLYSIVEDSNIVPLSIRLPKALHDALHEKATREGIGVAELCRGFLSFFLYPDVVKGFMGDKPDELHKKNLIYLRRAFEDYEKEVKSVLKDAETKQSLLDTFIGRYEKNLNEVQNLKEDLINRIAKKVKNK